MKGVSVLFITFCGDSASRRASSIGPECTNTEGVDGLDAEKLSVEWPKIPFLAIFESRVHFFRAARACPVGATRHCTASQARRASMVCALLAGLHGIDR